MCRDEPLVRDEARAREELRARGLHALLKRYREEEEGWRKPLAAETFLVVFILILSILGMAFLVMVVFDLVA